MIKLKSLLYELDDISTPRLSDIRKLAILRGYKHFTYRGDVESDSIASYTRHERREYGIFTTQYKEVAATYSHNKNPRKFYVKADKILNLMDDSLENMKWVNKWGESFDDWRDPRSGEELTAWDFLSTGQMFDYEGNWSSERWMDIQGTADSDGYDVVILPDSDSSVGTFPSFVIFDEHNLKLSDAITYDDDKQPIPLDQRFNVQSDDIRY